MTTKVRLDDPAARARLADFIAAASGAQVTGLEASPLSGGAIQENWLVVADLDGKRQEKPPTRQLLMFLHQRANRPWPDP